MHDEYHTRSRYIQCRAVAPIRRYTAKMAPQGKVPKLSRAGDNVHKTYAEKVKIFKGSLFLAVASSEAVTVLSINAENRQLHSDGRCWYNVPLSQHDSSAFRMETFPLESWDPVSGEELLKWDS